MKKGLLQFGILLVVVLGLIACSNGGNTSEESSLEGNVSEGQSEESFELKFGMVAGNQQNEFKAAERLAEYVHAESDGRLTLKL